ncbi:uncharacterized protein [Salvelinus sp. IW2-2015]|uniref:uncharacterized protein n=1 Tax=Salvelinus sp. IW2-2015 TaxID=2691554 RepID=UPI000CEB2A13|nr:uncharacterized protein LOC112068799 [Salvelinus alpinus]XP_023991775.1 uncharacterized protein LOC112068799 [Salvelinus alpinus]XP_023991776.1 uncharacterized protein LOC112068799 [Salvelinus alpinus]
MDRGRFKVLKGKEYQTLSNGIFCLLGLNSGPANWPAIFRLVEAICSHLCQIHPSTTQSAGVKKSRRALILADYVAIRVAMLNSPRLMAQTNLQLFELNQRTISQWYSRCQKEMERMVLQQGLELAPAPSVNAQPLPAAKPVHYQREGIQAPFPFPTLPPAVPRQATQQGRSAHSASPPGATTPRTSWPLPAQGPPTGSSLPPRTTAWRGQPGRDEGNTSSTSAPNAGCRSGGRRGTAASAEWRSALLLRRLGLLMHLSQNKRAQLTTTKPQSTRLVTQQNPLSSLHWTEKIEQDLDPWPSCRLAPVVSQGSWSTLTDFTETPKMAQMNLM